MRRMKRHETAPQLPFGNVGANATEGDEGRLSHVRA